MNSDQPTQDGQGIKTKPFVHHTSHPQDTISDPALDDTEGHDWADEGGALPAHQGGAHAKTESPESN